MSEPAKITIEKYIGGGCYIGKLGGEYPIAQAHRIARRIAARNRVHSSWDLREYARPIDVYVEWDGQYIATYTAPIVYEESIGEMISRQGYACI